MSKLLYQTLQVDRQNIITSGPSTRGQALSAGVNLLHQVSVGLNNLALSHRVNRELEALQPQIDAIMPALGGVLVCVGIQEWEIPDATGTRAKGFLSIHIAGVGASPQEALRRYLNQARIVQGTPRGWRRRDVFIWATRK